MGDFVLSGEAQKLWVTDFAVFFLAWFAFACVGALRIEQEQERERESEQ